MIYVRSRRPLLTIVGAAGACALVFALMGWAALQLPAGWVAAVALWAGCMGGFLVAAWAGLSLHRWPLAKLAFFRDRLVVLRGRHEMLALWEQMESVTLADTAAWPELRMTDWVTVTVRHQSPMRFKPADFGLDPTGCRDLLLRLRDEPELRGRLPEFDSDKDLEAAPLVAGETAEPRF